MDKNRTYAIIGALTGLALGGYIVLLIVNPSVGKEFAASIPTIIGLAIFGALQVAKSSETDRKMEAVKETLEQVDTKVETAVKQTNGMLHRRDEEINRLTDIVVANDIDPTTIPIRVTDAEHGSAEKEV